MSNHCVANNHCAYCYGKFGLVRHRRGFKSLCSKACVDRYIAWLRADVRKRRGWLDCLYSTCGHVINDRSEAAPNLRALGSVGLLVGLAALLASFATKVEAQEFRIEEALSVPGLAVAQIKPKTIAFIDRPGEELIDPDAGLMRFEDWMQARPVQKQFLSPYPSYHEPNVEIAVDAVRRRVKEKLHMYVGQARFALARSPDTIDLTSFVTLPFVERMDPAIKHRVIRSAEAISPKHPRAEHNQHPLRRWCEARQLAICIHSRYQLEGKLPIGIAIANKIRESPRKIADYLEFESELTVRSPAEVAETGLAALSGLDTPSIGALEQNIFYVNQMMQFGKLLAIFQRHPTDADQTVATIFMALAIELAIIGKQTKYANVPVLRNLVPAQVLAGKSSFNSGKSISAGLPVYARNRINAIAELLEQN